MGRRAKPLKGKAEPKRARASTPAKNEGSRIHDLEKRLAEALGCEAEAQRREAEALRQLQTRDRELVEAHEQQTATSEILRVISSSPNDLQPVLDIIAERATALTNAVYSAVYLIEGEWIHLHAWYSHGIENTDQFAASFPMPITSETLIARALRTGTLANIGDMEDIRVPEAGRMLARTLGVRSTLAVPMQRDGHPIGAIGVNRREAHEFTPGEIALLESFADHAVIAIENVRLFKELEARNRELRTALDTQTATSDILSVISRSQTDVQPVFNAIVQCASRLCEAEFSAVVRFEDGLLHLAGTSNVSSAEIEAYHSLFPRPPRRDFIMGRAFLDGRPVHVEDVLLDPDYDPHTLEVLQRAATFRTYLRIPIVRNGIPIGAIGCGRHEMRPFTEAQVELVKTFADQAVIAIENVRLFMELEGRNRDLTEALDQQTATSEILRVISSSPTDIQPVLEAVGEAAPRLCDASDVTIFRVEGDVLHLAVHRGPIGSLPPYGDERVSLKRGSVVGRSIIERRTIHILDLSRETEEYPEACARARRFGYRTVLSVPLLRDGVAIGAIAVRRAEAQFFTERQVALLQTFADQAVIAIENVRLFNELQASNRDLRTALDTQTATSDILRVISRSQTDVQPVFDTIVTSAGRLLRGNACTLSRIEGDQISLAAMTSIDDAGDASHRARFPMSIHSQEDHAQAVRNRAPLNSTDAHSDPRLPETQHASARLRGYRSLVVVPLVRHDEAVGALGVARPEPGGFTDDEIALLQTFADQAVIAIENVRLFRELEARNRDLMATGEILQVISHSPTDIQPVLDAVAESAARLCEAFDVVIFRREDNRLRLVAHHGSITVGAIGEFTLPLVREVAGGRAVLDGHTIHVADLQTEEEEFPRSSEDGRRMGFRTILCVPLIREGVAIGTINLRRTEVQPFTDKQIALLQTFADQAVIAIQNVRLFTELEARNNDLRVALEQQTATSELLKVIGRSTFDLQPVFEALAENAVRLCEAEHAFIFRFDGELLRCVATHNIPPALKTFVEANPVRPGRGSGAGRAALERRTIHIEDMRADPEYTYGVTQVGPMRTLLAIPMLRANELLGVIIITRPTVRLFIDSQIALMETFADQAAIAIENARLLSELQTKTGELTQSVEKLTALGEVGRAVSSTLDLETVLTTIVSRAVQLSGLDGGVVFEYDEAAEEFAQRAMTDTGGALAEARRTTRIRKGEGVLGRTAITLEPVQVPDIARPGAYEGRLRETLIESGVRAILAVPMVREGHLIGCLGVTRNQPGDFPAETIELLRTFATQSALAIQNARLFREIEDKSRQLEAASQHKSEFLANMSHELRTPLNAIIGFSEVLNERMFGELNEKQDEYLKDIYASGQHLLSLINDILDLSKIEAGRMELEATDFDLPSAIDNALILVRERATRRGIILGRTIEDRVGIVRGDERKVKQVLLNLLSNALKFTPEGGRIDVRAAMSDGIVEVSVADTGVGIAPEDQEAIFEEFRQVGTADKKVEGTGLGLALSRKFIELHGGRIWVTSTVGQGSTFTFTLPVCRERDDREDAPTLS